MAPLEFAEYCGMRPHNMSFIPDDDLGPRKEWFKSSGGNYLCYSCRGSCIVIGGTCSIFFDRVELLNETFSFFLCNEVAASMPVSEI